MKRVNQAIPIFAVRDLDEAIRHYRDKLGFTIAWSWGIRRCGWGPRSTRSRYNSSAPATPDLHGWSVVYCLMVGVEEYYAACRARGAVIAMELGARPWGVRDFRVIDPSGNRIGFAECNGVRPRSSLGSSPTIPASARCSSTASISRGSSRSYSKSTPWWSKPPETRSAHPSSEIANVIRAQAPQPRRAGADRWDSSVLRLGAVDGPRISCKQSRADRVVVVAHAQRADLRRRVEHDDSPSWHMKGAMPVTNGMAIIPLSKTIMPPSRVANEPARPRRMVGISGRH